MGDDFGNDDYDGPEALNSFPRLLFCLIYHTSLYTFMYSSSLCLLPFSLLSFPHPIIHSTFDCPNIATTKRQYHHHIITIIRIAFCQRRIINSVQPSFYAFPACLPSFFVSFILFWIWRQQRQHINKIMCYD